MKLLSALFASAFALGLGILPASAAIGLSHITQVGNTFNVEQTYGKGDYTGFVFAAQGASYQFATFLDEGIDAYRIALNAEISPASIPGLTSQRLTFPTLYSFPAFFYLALVTPSQDFTASSYPTAYGWALFSNSNGVITLLDHAIDYSSQGLYAGTTTLVPESGTASLTMAAAGLLVFGTRRRPRLPSA